MFQRYEIKTKASPDLLNEKVIFGPSGRFARNRLLKAAMSERLGSWVDGDLQKSGIPTQQYCNLYEKFGHGGFGTILTGNIIIDSDHIEGVGNVIVEEKLNNHERREGFRKMASVAKSEGSILIGQLNHCGAQTLKIFNKTPFSASDVKVDSAKVGAEYGDPIPLTTEQIQTHVVEKFAFAAKFLYEMGFDGVEIHGANGFLLAEFMSPRTNKRTDEYGGSKENRVRIVLEVFNAIRRAVPLETGFIVGIKMNSVEFQNDGLDVQDAIWMCQQFEKVGFDFIELSGGNFENLGLDNTRNLSTNKREAYFYEFARQIKPKIPITTVFVTGGFRTLPAMISAVKNHVTDGIGLGRPAAAEPDIAKKILKLNIQSATLNSIEDTRLQLAAAMTQLIQAGKVSLAKSHQDPCYGLLDISNKQETDKFIPAYLEFMEKTNSQLAQGKLVNISYNHPIMF